jgi:hypothetical protein
MSELLLKTLIIVAGFGLFGAFCYHIWRDNRLDKEDERKEMNQA